MENQRYFLQISYKGTNYHGWQSQNNAIAIQDIINDVLSKKLSENINITGAGRTDTGVHASYYIAHFDSVSMNLDKEDDLINSLNSFLPEDISIHKITKVNNDFHSRYDAVSRTYKYFITRIKDPFCSETALYHYGPLDINKMNKCCEILIKYDDFESFCKLHSDNDTFICKIKDTKWIEEDAKFIFTITADRFLRNMVRSIVGTMLDVGKGKTSIEKFIEIIESKDRSKAGFSAPAHGLFLTGIQYHKII
ncbi:MAG: tRNA pseudouridine(38-40) synthase TruA [Bacteroidota bacterium]